MTRYCVEFTNPDGSIWRTPPLFSSEEMAWERSEMILSLVRLGRKNVYEVMDATGVSADAGEVVDGQAQAAFLVAS